MQIIEAIDRAIDVLELLAERQSARLADLPAELHVSRSTAFRILVTLQQRGYVERLPDQSGYRLGAKAVRLAAVTRASILRELAGRELAHLQQATGETVNFALWEDDHLVYTAIREGRFALRMANEVGEIVPLHSTALGKAVLAALPSNEQLRLLRAEPYAAYTPHTITTWAALAREIRHVQTQGFAVDVEEMDMGAACVGASIVSSIGRPEAAISVSGFIARVSAEQRRAYGELVAESCLRIAEGLGYRDDTDGRGIVSDGDDGRDTRSAGPRRVAQHEGGALEQERR